MPHMEKDGSKVWTPQKQEYKWENPSINSKEVSGKIVGTFKKYDT